MTGFRNPIIGGGGALVYPAIHSPNYVPGVSGWTINKDGTSEFADSVIRGMVQAGPDTGSHIIIDPDVEVGFNDGFLEAVVRMFPEDPNFMMEGMLGVVTFGEGQADAEMSTVLHSPVLDGGSGYGLVMVAQADDFSRDAHAAIGPITAEGNAMTFVGIHMIEDYGLTSPSFLSYASQPGEIVETFQNPGAFTWQAPVGVTSVKIECWGGGGAGGSRSGTLGGGGGGGGEYARRASASVTPGNIYNGTVGAGATTPGGDGGDSTITTDSSSTTAHGGSGGSNQFGGAGGTGTVIGTHHDGGNGGSTAFGSGAGGGGAAGTNTPGTLGNPGDSHGFGGNGGAGGSLGGGTGGKGGNSSAVGTGSPSGARGSAPGAGGGGSGNGAGSLPGAGADGQIRLTYTPAIIPISASQAAASGTDRFGNTYPAGFAFNGNTVPDASRFGAFRGVASSTQAISTARTDVTSMTVTFDTVAPNALVIVQAQWDVTVSAGVAGTGNISVGEIVVDGVLQTVTAVGPESATARTSFNLAAVPVILASPGSHTIKGTIRKNGTATAAISAGNGSFITCQVFDFFS